MPQYHDFIKVESLFCKKVFEVHDVFSDRGQRSCDWQFYAAESSRAIIAVRIRSDIVKRSHAPQQSVVLGSGDLCRTAAGWVSKGKRGNLEGRCPNER
jgi:hypothetical protein